MNKRIFLSYSRPDEPVVEGFYKLASARELNVWYDKMIPAGSDWRDSIVDAIKKSDALLIFFSEESNRSRQLIKELAIADKFGTLVIPILIENTEPRGAYLYEMAARNWINLHPNPLSRMEALLEQLMRQLGVTAANGGASVSTAKGGPPPAVPDARKHGPIAAPAPAIEPDGPTVVPAGPTPDGWPVKKIDLLVLGPLLVLSFILGVTVPTKDYPAAGLNIVLLLIYMFVVAIRSARLNIGITSLKSFAIYFLISLLIFPFGLAMDWINGVQNAYGDLMLGLSLFALIVAALANVVQVVLRNVFMRNLFESRLGTPLPAE